MDSRRILNRSCKGDSDGGAGGGRSVMATSGISAVFPGLPRPEVGASMRQMSRLRAALRFFWFPLAARRLATVFTAQRRLGNAELAAVGLGFERSLVSAVTCFWPDSGYYSTPSRPQCFKLIQLAAAGQNNESRLGWADPVSSQLDAYPTKTAAKSPFRPVSDGWRPLGRLCSLASMSYTTLACLLYTSPSPRDRQKSRMPSSA